MGKFAQDYFSELQLEAEKKTLNKVELKVSVSSVSITYTLKYVELNCF